MHINQIAWNVFLLKGIYQYHITHVDFNIQDGIHSRWTKCVLHKNLGSFKFNEVYFYFYVIFHINVWNIYFIFFGYSNDSNRLHSPNIVSTTKHWIITKYNWIFQLVSFCP